MDRHALAARIRAEFNEMPGLRLTMVQAQRLWGIESTICVSVIDALVEDAFLRRTDRGAFVRAA